MTLWERFRRCFVDGDTAPAKAYFRFSKATECHREKLVHEAELHRHGSETLETFLYARCKQPAASGGLVADERTIEEMDRSNRILEERRQAIEQGTYVAPPSMAEALAERLLSGTIDDWQQFDDEELERGI